MIAILATPAPDTLPTPEHNACARRPLLDFARLLAAISIVWLHTMRSPQLIDSTALGRFAVPFFTAAAVFMICESLARGRRKSLTEYNRNRFLRLYVPFLAWTAIYLGFKQIKAKLAPGQPNHFPGLEVLLTGGFYHLWFLPYVFAVSVVTFAIARKCIGNPIAETRMALLCALAGGTVAAAPVSPELIPAETWQAYWWMALPAAFWGVAIAVFTQHARASYRNNRVVPLCGLAVFALGTAVTWHAGRNALAENLSGVGFLVFALGPWQGNFIRRCAGLGTLAYGIYLSHLLFIKICEAVVAKFDVPISAALDLAVFAFSLIGSLLLTWLLTQSRATRWLVA